jgi:TRAP-type C4-dicarboxylate transport system permease small subunit
MLTLLQEDLQMNVQNPYQLILCLAILALVGFLAWLGWR